MPRQNPERVTDPVRATRTRHEFARIVGCGINSVDQLIDSGKVDVIGIGVKRLITVASIERLLGISLTDNSRSNEYTGEDTYYDKDTSPTPKAKRKDKRPAAEPAQVNRRAGGRGAPLLAALEGKPSS